MSRSIETSAVAALIVAAGRGLRAGGDRPKQYRLVDVSGEEVELMRQMLQAMDQEFGYISAADASASGLNQSHTATGIASIERSGNNIVKAVERVVADAARRAQGAGGTGNLGIA